MSWHLHGRSDADLTVIGTELREDFQQIVYVKGIQCNRLDGPDQNPRKDYVVRGQRGEVAVSGAAWTRKPAADKGVSSHTTENPAQSAKKPEYVAQRAKFAPEATSQIIPALKRSDMLAIRSPDASMNVEFCFRSELW